MHERIDDDDIKVEIADKLAQHLLVRRMNNLTTNVARDRKLLVVDTAMNEQPISYIGELDFECLACRLDAPLDLVARFFIVDQPNAALFGDVEIEKVFAGDQQNGLFHGERGFTNTRRSSG